MTLKSMGNGEMLSIISRGQNNEGFVLHPVCCGKTSLANEECFRVQVWDAAVTLTQEREIYQTLWDMYKICSQHLFFFTCKYSPWSILDTLTHRYSPTHLACAHTHTQMICTGTTVRIISSFRETFDTNRRKNFAQETKVWTLLIIDLACWVIALTVWWCMA